MQFGRGVDSHLDDAGQGRSGRIVSFDGDHHEALRWLRLLTGVSQRARSIVIGPLGLIG
jgi:hypothetical protein